MSKFKIKVKITGFELEIEGDRQDIPALTRSVGKQLSGLVTPPSTDVFEDAEIVQQPSVALPEASKPTPKRKRSNGAKSSKSASSSSSSGASNALDLDVRTIQGKYGVPRQQWSSSDKLMWLLYVVDKESIMQGMNSMQLKETYNKHFRTTGSMTKQHTADLRKKVISNPALVGKDTSQESPAWYLTESGYKHVDSLLATNSGASE